MILLFLACSRSGSATLDTGDTGADAPSATVQPGQVVVAEVMFDPALVDGDFGEWFEVRNVSGDTIDLGGVVVQDDDAAGFAVDGPLPVPAGDVVVFGPSADTAQNGGVPVDWAYSIDAVKLGNEGDSVSLTANGVLLDRFTWDATVYPVAEGAALQLAPTVADPDANDTPDVWCLARVTYGAGDLGTPGAANSSCD